MKKSLKNVVCLLALVAITVPAFAAITSSAHDFSGASWNTTDQDICGVCHTPHGGTQQGDAPLWGHAMITDTSGYTMYSSDTMNYGADPNGPDGESLLCLSCHDGSLALDTGGSTTVMTGTAKVGPDLSGSHPISFVYADDTDSELVASTDADVQTLLGAGGKVQCSSCHDVHDGADLGTDGYLLRMANTNSDLCLTCHDK
ncbi:MAG: cytochrome c3 family protein [Planctomycetota bacterium]|jgi:predicted CXXCH cytochrome family protein